MKTEINKIKIVMTKKERIMRLSKCAVCGSEKIKIYQREKN